MAGHEVEWRRRLAGALVAVVAVGLVIGGVLGAVAYSTARVAGLVEERAQVPAAAADEGDSDGQVSPDVSPSGTPQASAEVEQAKSGKDKATGGEKAARDKKAAKHPRGKKDATRAGKRRPTLSASPRAVRSMGRIHLVGRYPGHGGARLAVQRLERGRWVRFPVSVTVRSGRFRTWVASGQRGVNRFRVVDTRTRRASEPVTVRVR
jgi:hypothetical protein